MILLCLGKARAIPTPDDFLHKAVEADKAWIKFLTKLAACEIIGNDITNCKRWDLFGELDMRLYRDAKERMKDFFDLEDKNE